MRRVISVVLMLLLVISAAVPAFAENEEEITTDFAVTDAAESMPAAEFSEELATEEAASFETVTELPEEGTEQAEVTDEPTEPEPEEPQEPDSPDPQEPLPDDVVVKMYLCATANSFTGHVWLYFENLTGFELPLGFVTLLPGEKMSVGSLRNTRKDGGGTYYNGEAFMAKNREKVCAHTTAMSTELTLLELEKVSEEIKSRNTYVFFAWNCGNFACNVWNAAAETKVHHVVLPVFTVLGMRAKGGVKGELFMEKPDISRVFKQEKNGAVQADEKSFRMSCIG